MRSVCKLQLIDLLSAEGEGETPSLYVSMHLLIDKETDSIGYIVLVKKGPDKATKTTKWNRIKLWALYVQVAHERYAGSASIYTFPGSSLIPRAFPFDKCSI